MDDRTSDLMTGLLRAARHRAHDLAARVVDSLRDPGADRLVEDRLHLEGEHRADRPIRLRVEARFAAADHLASMP